MKVIFLLLLFLISCTSKEKELIMIPEEFCGEWISEDNNWKKIITPNSIYIVDISSINDILGLDFSKHSLPEFNSDTIKKVIASIYLVGRKNCNDCTNYGIKIMYKDEYPDQESLYLDSYHPRLEKYIELTEIESAVDPDDDTRKYFKSEVWKRNDLQ